MLRILLALFIMSRNWNPRPRPVKLDFGDTTPDLKPPFV